ncbi:hypothetical protein PYL11_12065 [Staphylococcus epidermidis]|uniref:LpxL/LpxP family acyltransferase n=1 Tax=Staphylococcus caprae TaxID=29380 RepID=UPI00138E1F13|nr:hypothetical protein [Staphylococcus epidermidis]
MNNVKEYIEGFFSSSDLDEHSNQLKKLKILPFKDLYSYFYKIRKEELDLVKKHSDFFEDQIQIAENNIKKTNIKRYNRKDLNNLVDHLMLDCTIWLYLTFIKNKKLFEENVIIKNENILIEALEEGKGVILGQTHFGPFQMLTPLLLSKGYPVFQIFGEKEAEKWVENLVDEYIGNATYSSSTVTENNSLRKAIKGLQENKALCIPVEVNGTDIKPKQTVDFLGDKIYAPDGACRMSYLTKSPLILVDVYLKEEKLIISFNNPRYVNNKKDISIINKNMFKEIEKKVEEDKELWRGWFFYDEMLVQE